MSESIEGIKDFIRLEDEDLCKELSFYCKAQIPLPQTVRGLLFGKKLAYDKILRLIDKNRAITKGEEMKVELDLIKHFIKLDLDDLKKEMSMDYFKELPENSFFRGITNGKLLVLEKLLQNISELETNLSKGSER